MCKAAHTHMPICVKMAPDTAAEVVLLLRALVIASMSRSHQDMPTGVQHRHTGHTALHAGGMQIERIGERRPPRRRLAAAAARASARA